jgi:periplasmic protein TonB
MALGISISLLASIFVLMHLDSKISDRHCDKKSHISFSVLAKSAPKPIQETPIKPQPPKPEKIEPPKPKPIVKPKPVEKIIPKPEKTVVAKKEEPKPQPPKPEPEVTQAPPPPPLQNAVDEAKVSALARAEKEAQIEEVKRAFLTKLREKIEENRHYPHRARMRGIEGTVDVAFEVHADGKVHSVNIKSGHQLLGHAVEEAIKKSFPVQIPKLLKAFPMNVTLQIVFKLS